MDTKIRQGLGLLVVAAVAFVLSLPAGDSGAGQVWGMVAGSVALVCGLVGATFLAIGLFRPQSD